jgi:hypothetical protein
MYLLFPRKWICITSGMFLVLAEGTKRYARQVPLASMYCVGTVSYVAILRLGGRMKDILKS